MIVTLLLWVFAFSSLLLTGLAMATFFPSWPKPNVVKTVLMGFAVVFILTGWLSLIVPINKVLLGGILIVDFTILAIKKDRFQQLFSHWLEESKSLPRLFWAFIGATILVFAYAASSPIGLLDTALYHAQNIRWIQEYAVVPGLGNLHGRFAFNSMFFPVSALFSVLVAESESAHILVYPLNPVLVILLISTLIHRISISVQAKSNQRTAFYLLVLFPAMVMYPNWINAPSPDFISAAIVIFAFLFAMDLNKDPSNKFTRILLILVVFISITVKLSSMFLILLLLPMLWRAKSNLRKRLTTICAIGLLLGTPFLVRNYVLSGYLIYPFPAIDVFDVDWKIPTDIANQEKAHVANWAKIPHVSAKKIEAMSVQEWLPEWWKRKPLPMKGILLVNVFGVLALVSFLLRKRYLLAWLQTVVLVSLGFIFLNGPDPRFVHGFLFIGLGLVVLSVLEWISLKIVLNQWLVAVFLGACILGGLVKSDVAHGTFLLPHGLEKVGTTTVSTNFNYFIPVEKQTCFYNLPCAPEKNKFLRLRGETLQSGFRVERDALEE